MRGRPGYGAVRLAMAHWRPDFDDVPRAGIKPTYVGVKLNKRQRGINYLDDEGKQVKPHACCVFEEEVLPIVANNCYRSKPKVEAALAAEVSA